MRTSDCPNEQISFLFLLIVKDISYFRKWIHLSSRSCSALLTLQLPQTLEKSSRNISRLEVLLVLMTFNSRSDPHHHPLHPSKLRAVPALHNWAIQPPGGFLHFLFLRDFFPNRSIMINCTSCSQRQVLAIPALVFNNHSLISCLLRRHKCDLQELLCHAIQTWIFQMKYSKEDKWVLFMLTVQKHTYFCLGSVKLQWGEMNLNHLLWIFRCYKGRCHLIMQIQYKNMIHQFNFDLIMSFDDETSKQVHSNADLFQSVVSFLFQQFHQPHFRGS